MRWLLLQAAAGQHQALVCAALGGELCVCVASLIPDAVSPACGGGCWRISGKQPAPQAGAQGPQRRRRRCSGARGRKQQRRARARPAAAAGARRPRPSRRSRGPDRIPDAGTDPWMPLQPGRPPRVPSGVSNLLQLPQSDPRGADPGAHCRPRKQEGVAGHAWSAVSPSPQRIRLLDRVEVHRDLPEPRLAALLQTDIDGGCRVQLLARGLAAAGRGTRQRRSRAERSRWALWTSARGTPIGKEDAKQAAAGKGAASGKQGGRREAARCAAAQHTARAGRGSAESASALAPQALELILLHCLCFLCSRRNTQASASFGTLWWMSLGCKQVASRGGRKCPGRVYKQARLAASSSCSNKTRRAAPTGAGTGTGSLVRAASHAEDAKLRVAHRRVERSRQAQADLVGFECRFVSFEW